MSTAEIIFWKAQALPRQAQNAVLTIAELLAESASDREEWNRFSLSSAMKSFEDEKWPDYTAAASFEKRQ